MDSMKRSVVPPEFDPPVPPITGNTRRQKLPISIEDFAPDVAGRGEGAGCAGGERSRGAAVGGHRRGASSLDAGRARRLGSGHERSPGS
jgi:hypothetical protein